MFTTIFLLFLFLSGATTILWFGGTLVASIIKRFEGK